MDHAYNRRVGPMDAFPRSVADGWFDGSTRAAVSQSPPAPASVVESGVAPQQFELFQNNPNPFNPSTMIQYSLEKTTQVSLKIYNMLGNEVATLVHSRQEAGSYTVSFNSNSGKLNLSSGVYLYRLEAGSFVSTKKLVLIK